MKFLSHIKICIYSILVLSICFKNSLNAQDVGRVFGKLEDSAKNVLPLATITVYKAIDTSIITFKLSDTKGTFSIGKLPINVPLRLIITFSGYDVVKKEFSLLKDNPQLDYGTILLIPDSRALEEIIVFSERPPIMIRNDTVEFNASSFKTLPNALLEDLLKKLPGVVIDRNGDISFNGKNVNRIIVDGKDFFGSDPSIASKNLPANIIDKIQVMDDQDELDQNLLLQKGDVGKVINIKFKRSIKRAAFGRVYSSIGSSTRYEAGGILNTFRDTFQVSLLAYSNNLNRPGFGMSDIKELGGFDRSGYSSSMYNKQGGFSLDGISFGATSEGIQTSSGAGVNINTETKQKASINFKYFFGNIKSKLAQESSSQFYFNDTILETISTKYQTSRDHQHLISGSIKWQITSHATLTLRSSLNIFLNESNKKTSLSQSNNYNGILNKGLNHQLFKQTGISFNNSISYITRDKKGRSFSSTFQSSTNNRKNDRYLFQENIAYYPYPGIDSLDQLRHLDYPNIYNRLNLSYSLPLDNTSRLTFSENIQYSNKKHAIHNFSKGPTDEYSNLIDSISGSVKQNIISNQLSISLSYYKKKLMISPGINLNSMYINNKYPTDPSTKNNAVYLYPSFIISYNGFRLNYTAYLSEPFLEYFQLAPDYSNPLQIFTGNALLNPFRSNSIYFTFDKYDTKRSLIYRFLLSNVRNLHAVITEKKIGSNGVAVHKPVNSNNAINSFRFGGSIAKSISVNSTKAFSVSPAFYITESSNPLVLNNIQSLATNFTFNPSLNYSYDKDGKFHFSQQYDLKVSRSTFSNDLSPALLLTTHTLLTELNYFIVPEIFIESKVEYYYFPKNKLIENRNNVFLNTGLAYYTSKSHKGVIKFEAINLLNQSINSDRLISYSEVSQTRTTLITRYFIAKFSYDINNIGKKVVAANRLLPF